MPKILIAGAGGAPSEGVIYSLKRNENNFVIGMGSEPADLVLSSAEKKYYVPYANDDSYRSALMKVLETEKPDLVHFQNDLKFSTRLCCETENLLATGTKLFMPDHAVIDTCVHKYKSFEAFVASDITVPNNIFIKNEMDLRRAFSELGDAEGRYGSEQAQSEEVERGIANK